MFGNFFFLGSTHYTRVSDGDSSGSTNASERIEGFPENFSIDWGYIRIRTALQNGLYRSVCITFFFEINGFAFNSFYSCCPCFFVSPSFYSFFFGLVCLAVIEAKMISTLLCTTIRFFKFRHTTYEYSLIIRLDSPKI